MKRSEDLGSSRQRVEAALSGALSWPELTDDERLLLNAAIDAQTVAGARDTSFGVELRAQGFTSIALDVRGVLSRRHPDGRVDVLD